MPWCLRRVIGNFDPVGSENPVLHALQEDNDNFRIVGNDVRFPGPVWWTKTVVRLRCAPPRLRIYLPLLAML
jgi:hypothetical protein